MPGFRTGLLQWRRRRVSLAEEWKFHQERVALELMDAGLSEAEAYVIAAERLGRDSRYQHESYAESGADWKGLLRLVAPRPLRREAWLVPGVLALALALLFALNPYRHQVAASLTGPVHVFQEMVQPPRWAVRCVSGASFVNLGPKLGPPDPCVINAHWVKPWQIPAGFAQISCLIGILAGMNWLVRRTRAQKQGTRVWVYAVLNLALGSLLAAAAYTASVQWMLVGPGGSDLKDGLGIVALWFVWGPSFLILLQLWKKDVVHRCPWCLERLQWPVERGEVDSILLNPTEVESVCLAGHGTQTDSRWGEEFRESGKFWEDLDRDQCREGFSSSESEYSKE